MIWITMSGIKNLARKALLLFLILLTGNIISAKAQNIAVKNNILYDASTTPNFGIELRLSNKWTAGINVALNPWTFSDNKKLKHLLVAPQLRYWLCESFSGHYFGANIAYVHYNVSDIKFPFGLYGGVDGERRQGDLAAIGASYGYSWILSPHWSLEAEAGLDLGYTWYDRYNSPKCGTYRGSDNKFLVLPKLALNIVYIIKTK